VTRVGYPSYIQRGESASTRSIDATVLGSARPHLLAELTGGDVAPLGLAFLVSIDSETTPIEP
jgi:hypothetical protein